MPTMRTIQRPENAGLDYRAGSRISDPGQDEDFFMIAVGVKLASVTFPGVLRRSRVFQQRIWSSASRIGSRSTMLELIKGSL
ncbi:MAG TPA: hypothetical protein VLB69_05115 [Rudaea sp.]|nr:hypothetical protein [Rudaea sp.]